jgi:hypothetical protein
MYVVIVSQVDGIPEHVYAIVLRNKSPHVAPLCLRYDGAGLEPREDTSQIGAKLEALQPGAPAPGVRRGRSISAGTPGTSSA